MIITDKIKIKLKNFLKRIKISFLNFSNTTNNNHFVLQKQNIQYNGKIIIKSKGKIVEIECNLKLESNGDYQYIEIERNPKTEDIEEFINFYKDIIAYKNGEEIANYKNAQINNGNGRTETFSIGNLRAI